MTWVSTTASRSWKVGERTVTLTISRPTIGSDARAGFEWTPDVPTKLSAEEWVEYRAGRHAALTEIAEALQINVGVLDV